MIRCKKCVNLGGFLHLACHCMKSWGFFTMCVCHAFLFLFLSEALTGLKFVIQNILIFVNPIWTLVTSKAQMLQSVQKTKINFSDKNILIVETDEFAVESV